MRALLQGIPKGFWSEDWSRNFVNALPMGVFAIANFCNARGHDVRVANASVFGSREAAVDVLLRRLAERDVEVVGLPLHWHLAGYDVLRTATFLKEVRPSLRVVVGGLTASVYPREILETFPAVDAVIAGDGEVPFCSFLDALEALPQHTDFSAVPNLVWREGSSIRNNGIQYIATPEQLSMLDFSPQSTLCSPIEYANGLRLRDAVHGIPADLAGQPFEQRFFFMNIGRGCSYNCLYCGGSRLSHHQYTGREGVTVRSVDSVVADFERCHAAGFRRFHICFDPAFPNRQKYFEDLFDGVRRAIGSGCHLLFEAYGLPTRPFLEAASCAFSWVGIVVSPCFFDDSVRRECKGYSFTDEEMEAGLREIASVEHCRAFVYYAVTARERWDEAMVRSFADRAVRLRERTGAAVTVMPVFAEPGSPWISFPGEFGGRQFDFRFEDFLEFWRQPLTGWNERLTGVAGIDEVMARFEEALGPEQ
jgi:B12 binding domain